MANTIKIKNSGTASNIPSSLEYGELSINYADGKIFYKNSSNTITQFVGQKGDTGATGAGGALGYWGSFWSTQNQTAAAANTAYAITLNNVDSNSTGVSVVSGSRVTFANAGVYSLTFSVQWVNTSNDIIDGNIWFRKNGTNVDDSDSKWSVISKHGGINGHAIGTVNLVLSLAAGDYIELVWQTTNTALSIEYIAAASPAPAIPSVIFTAIQVMYTQLPSETVLDDFQNVTVPSPSSGDFLKYNGTLWVNDQIDLGTDTVGNYVQSLVAGSGITLSNNSGEGATPTIALTSNSVTVNGTSIALGSSGTVTANAQTLTGTSLNSTVVGSSLTSVGNITTGTWSASTIAVSRGGTGATDAANARTNLGLAIGSNVQAYDSELQAISGLTANGYIARTSSSTAEARTITAGTGITVTNGDGVAGNTSIALTSSSITINGTSISLGGSGTATANSQTLTAVGANGTVLTSTGTATAWTANTGTGNVVRATSPSISNPTITTTSSNTIFIPSNTVVGNRYMALTNSASGYVIESISVGSGLSITASIDPTISINTSVVATLTGIQTLTNKTFGDRVIIDYQNNPTLAGVTGSLIIGGDGTGTHLTLDSNDLQAKTNSTAAATLQLNRLGGDITFGASLYNDSTSNFIEIGSNQATGISANSNTDIGVRLSGSGAIWASRNDGTMLVLNRMRHTAGGTIVEFRTNGVARGSITENAGTVSYNAFLGSHYTEIDGDEPLRGTIMESTGELVEGWLGDQSRLPKCKISETVSSKAVFGIYFGRTYAEDNTPNGHLVAAIGAAWVRMAPGYEVEVGDLIESNGDGCAKPQSDDVIRSSTIGKISSLVPAEVYEDNSYLLACVLYCG